MIFLFPLTLCHGFSVSYGLHASVHGQVDHEGLDEPQALQLTGWASPSIPPAEEGALEQGLDRCELDLSQGLKGSMTGCPLLSDALGDCDARFRANHTQGTFCPITL